LALSRADEGIFYQGPKMTHLVKRAVDDGPWDFVFPLDSDEFICVPDRSALERVAAAVDDGSIGWCDVVNYIPTVNDDWNEVDVLRRIVHRVQTIPEIKSRVGKVIIPRAVIQQPGFSLNEGHHGARVDDEPVPRQRVETLSLGHFPVRSIDQFILRAILSRLSWASRTDYNPGWSWHYKTFCEKLRTNPVVTVADLTEAALLYVDIYLQPEQTPHRKLLVREPVTPSYDRLQFASLINVAVLPPILDMAELLVGELREVRAATDARTPAGQRARSPQAGSSVQHTFQSFWHGAALSPYELFCMQSFIDCGYGLDLYTYDPNLAVPSGVRRCDASELFSRDEVFVYQAEGFGKESPSPFSNIFRYKLLAEKGGWWVDADVVCLSDRLPAVGEFFASQGDEFINGAILYFEPGHPVMAQCLDRAIQLGRTIKWGDTGPRMLTRVLDEHGLIDRAAPPAVCYPIHYSEALDALRPSRAAALAPRIESSLFLHVWNSMLVFHGVQKTCLPPRGSLLRNCIDKHQVEGWTGEYDEETLEQVLRLSAELAGRAGEEAGLRPPLAQRAAENDLLKAELSAHAEESTKRQSALDQLIAENVGLRRQLEAILKSASWRLTAPLRAGRRQFTALQSFRRRR
jgi:Alpha 1,4-glycosyltransferase conserved region